MNKKRLTSSDAGIAFLMSFILAQFTTAIGTSIVSYIMNMCGKSSNQIKAFFDTATGYLIQALFMNLAFILIFIWYIRHVNKHEVVAKPNKSTFKYFGICIIIGITTLFLVSGILNYFQLFIEKLGSKPSNIEYDLHNTKNYLISLISLAVIPAVCEELLFRGIIVNALKHKGHVFAIVLSSVMFSIFHFSPSQLIYPICFGLILSIVYLRTNNIIFPILLHFINNALSLSIQYFSNTSGGAFVHSTSILIYAIITFAIWIVIMYYLFKDFKSHTSSNMSNQTEIEVSTNDNKSSTNVKYNTKDNSILYASIVIMIFLYILLL